LRFDFHTTHHTKGRVAPKDLAVHRVQTLSDSDLVVVDGLRCTSATRTLLDLAAVVPYETLEAATMSALRYHTTSLSALGEQLERLGPRRRGARAVRRLIADNAGLRPAESVLEVKLSALLRSADFPPFERQIEVVGQDGRGYRIDAGWPDLRVGVEADGFEFHDNELRRKRDRRRVGAIEATGWQLLIVTWDDIVSTPERTIDRIRLAIQRALAVAS
jgi:very-short-patch-repair endonuclease